MSFGTDSRVCQNRTTGTNGMSRADPAMGTWLAAALGLTLAAGVGSTQPGARGATDGGAEDGPAEGTVTGLGIARLGSGLPMWIGSPHGGTGASVGAVKGEGAGDTGWVVGCSAWASSMTSSAAAIGRSAAVEGTLVGVTAAGWPTDWATERPARPQ